MFGRRSLKECHKDPTMRLRTCQTLSVWLVGAAIGVGCLMLPSLELVSLRSPEALVRGRGLAMIQRVGLAGLQSLLSLIREGFLRCRYSFFSKGCSFRTRIQAAVEKMRRQACCSLAVFATERDQNETQKDIIWNCLVSSNRPWSRSLRSCQQVLCSTSLSRGAGGVR